MKKLLFILLLAPLFVFGQTKIKTNQINPTLPANFKIISNGKYFGADTAYFGNVLTRPSLSGNFVFTGDSFVAGTGASPSTLRFSTQLSALMGLTEVNGGHPGISLGASGGTSVVSNLSTYIPTKGGSDVFLLICYGQNDVNVNTGTYFEHQFAADVVTVLNYATSHGWAANQIWWTNIGFNETTLASAIPGGLTLAQYTSRQRQFSFAIDSIAALNGCVNVKIQQLIRYQGATQLVASDNQHPNNLGHTLIAKLAYNTYYPNLWQDSHQLEASGLTQLNQVQLPKINTLPIGATIAPNLLGVTTGDTVGRLIQLPSGLGTATGGNFYINGPVIQTNWTTPSGYTIQNNDILLTQAGRVTGIFSSNTGFNIYNYLQPVDNGGGMDLVTNGSIVGAINLMPGNSTAFSVNSALKATFYGDLQGQVNKKYYYDSGTYQGGFIPFGSTGGVSTSVYNSYSLGFINFLVSNGSNGGSLEAGRIYRNGHLLWGGTVDNGFNIDVTGNGRFTTSFSVGSLLAPTLSSVTGSTSGGTIAAGAHYYVVYPVDANGGIGPTSNETGVTNTGSTSSNAIVYTAVTGAASYRIYVGTTPGGENQYITSSTTSVTDIGSGYTVAVLPTQNNSYLANISSTGSATFTGINNAALTASKVVFTDASKNLTSTGIGTSSQYILGDGTLGTIGAKAHTIFTPTTGGTITLINNQYNIVNPAGALVSLTVNLPSSPANNDCVFIKYTQAVTTVTYSGGTVIDGIVSPAAGGLVVLTYDSLSSSWY